MSTKAIILDRGDNVATATTDLKKGADIRVSSGESEINLVLRQDIPFGHKLALKDIKNGEAVVKYGEVIGRATADIGSGEYVHVHNIEGDRGRGDRK